MKYFLAIIIFLILFLAIYRMNNADIDSIKRDLINEQNNAVTNAKQLCTKKNMNYAGVSINSELKYLALCSTSSPPKIFQYEVSE